MCIKQSFCLTTFYFLTAITIASSRYHYLTALSDFDTEEHVETACPLCTLISGQLSYNAISLALIKYGKQQEEAFQETPLHAITRKREVPSIAIKGTQVEEDDFDLETAEINLFRPVFRYRAAYSRQVGTRGRQFG